MIKWGSALNLGNLEMNERIFFSHRALSKLVQIFDQVIERNNRVVSLLEGKSEPIESADEGGDVPEAPKFSIEKLDEKLRVEMKNIFNENSKLQCLVTKLQSENHRLSNQA